MNGSGLGLALVAKIIGEHGGVIECESQPRRTAFRILMPAHSGAAPDDDVRGCGMTATILVADDDAAIRTVLNQALSRAGYTVRLTSNAATLWRWVAEGEGDVVITDVVMPDGNAFDLIPRIKRTRPTLPIVVMSAQNTFMTAIRASEKGAYDYLPKPFDLKELIADRRARARRAAWAAALRVRARTRATPSRWSGARLRCRTSTACSRASCRRT